MYTVYTAGPNAVTSHPSISGPLETYTLTPANFGAKEDVCRRVGQSLRSTRTIVVLGIGGACGLEVERHPGRLWFVSKARIYAWLMDVR
jgi:hypothetical protein